MATRRELLKLSKKQLIKRCKKQRIKHIPSNPAKSQLIELLSSHLHSDTISVKTKKMKKLKKEQKSASKDIIIPYDFYDIKFVSKNDTIIEVIHQKRIGISVYNAKSQRFLRQTIITPIDQYPIDRLYLYSLNNSRTKLYALFAVQNGFTINYNKIIMYDIKTEKWEEKHDISINIYGGPFSKDLPYILQTESGSNHLLHIFELQRGIEGPPIIHYIWNLKTRSLKTSSLIVAGRKFKYNDKYCYHYDATLDRMFILYFQYDKLGHVEWINITWINLAAQISDDPECYNWSESIKIMFGEAEMHYAMDNWCIVKGRYLTIFHHIDGKIKILDLMDDTKQGTLVRARVDWIESRYRLPKMELFI